MKIDGGTNNNSYVKDVINTEDEIMQLLFEEEIIELENPVYVEEVIENINYLLGKSYYFSHFIADGKEITEAPESFLLDQAGEINTLEVVAIEAKTFINDLLLSAEEYVTRATPHIKDLSDAFSKKPTSDNWLTLNELLEGIQWLAAMITTVDQSIIRPANWGSVVEQATNLEGKLGSLETALENEDTGGVAEILEDEIQPAFEVFGREITSAIDREGERDGVN